MLIYRLRHQPNIKATLVRCFMLTGMVRDKTPIWCEARRLVLGTSMRLAPSCHFELTLVHAVEFCIIVQGHEIKMYLRVVLNR